MSDASAGSETAARPTPRYYPELQAALESMPPGQQFVAAVLAAEVGLGLTDERERGAEEAGASEAFRDGLRATTELVRDYLRGHAERSALSAAITPLREGIWNWGGPHRDYEPRLSWDWARLTSLVACLIGELDTVDPFERARYLAVTMARVLGYDNGFVLRSGVWWQRLLYTLSIADGFIAALDVPPPTPDAPDRLPLHRPADISLQAWPIEDMPGAGYVEMAGGFSITADEVCSAFEYHYAAGRVFVLADMTRMHYLNELDIGAVVRVADDAQQRGGAFACAAHPKVRVVIDMLGLHAHLNEFQTLDEARQFLVDAQRARSESTS